MKAIVTVIGKDKTGIIAAVTAKLTDCGANIEDISQTLMQEYFVMIMLADVSGSVGIDGLSKELTALGNKVGVDIRIQHEDIFNSMHRI